MFANERIYWRESYYQESKYFPVDRLLVIQYHKKLNIRFLNVKVSSNPEDAGLGKMFGIHIRGELKVNDPDIERIRR